MAHVVRDWVGETHELHAGAVDGHDAAGRRVTKEELRAAVANNPENLLAMAGALVDAGRTTPTTAGDLDYETLRTMLEDALADGVIALLRGHGRPAAEPGPLEPPEPLVPPVDPNEPEETHTLDFDLVDPYGDPVPRAAYEVKLPDGKVIKGNLNAQGQASITGIKKAGNCEITFTGFDQDAWVPA